MATSGHICDIPTLLSFFFQLHHVQSSTLHRISFFRKMCFYYYYNYGCHSATCTIPGFFKWQAILGLPAQSADPRSVQCNPQIAEIHALHLTYRVESQMNIVNMKFLFI